MNKEVMVPVSEKYHYKRLQEKGIVIEDRFIRESENRKEIYVRSSDGIRNDQILRLPRLEKLYFLNKKYIGRIKGKTNIKYTFYSNILNDEIVCQNCSHKSNSKDFLDGCPYCGTEFNMNYTTQNYGIKEMMEVLNTKRTYLVIFIITIFLYFLILKANNFKLITFIMSIIGVPILYFAVYLATMVIMLPVCIIRLFLVGEELSIWKKAQKLNLNVNEYKFYSDLNCELLKYLYDEKLFPEEKDLIDFQILKYNKIKVISYNPELIIEVQYTIQKIYLKGKYIRDIIQKHNTCLKYNKIHIENKGYTVINCPNCGNSLDITKKECEYCGTITNFKNEWSVISINGKKI